MRRQRNLNRRGYDDHTSGTSIITTKKSPVGSNVRLLTCRSCGSCIHLVRECPDSWENMSKMNTSVERSI